MLHFSVSVQLPPLKSPPMARALEKFMAVLAEGLMQGTLGW